MRLQLISAASLWVLVACAGSPLHVANSSNAREVQVGDDTAYVLFDGGMWLATYKDYFAKQVFSSPAAILQRKMGLIRAIEATSKCKVVESTQDPAGLTLQATVNCATQAMPQATIAASPPTATTAPTLRGAGEDKINAERVGKEQRCAADPRASLVAKGPGYETYSMMCSNASTLLVQCEFGNCRALR